MTFKEFYEDRYGVYPGKHGEYYHDIFDRLLSALPEYIEYVLTSEKE